MFTEDQRELVRRRIGEIELFVVATKGITIKQLGEQALQQTLQLATSTDALAPVLRTALVINWKEAAMMKRYDRFVSLFPDVRTLAGLKESLDSTDPLTFCREYLDIKANSESPEKNPKYTLLKNLTNAFLEYQAAHRLATEIEALRHWSDCVSLSDLDSDPIGSLHGVGKGVVENIRLNLGYRVIKPDRHVIGVMRKVLQIEVPDDRFAGFADGLGLDARYLDSILFEFGKENQISA